MYLRYIYTGPMAPLWEPSCSTLNVELRLVSLLLLLSFCDYIAVVFPAYLTVPITTEHPGPRNIITYSPLIMFASVQ